MSVVTPNEKSYFSHHKKGEIAELREELKSDRKDRKRDALKRIISNMTVGKDMSSLFTDVVNLVQTENKEIKKLVYLYLINYSRSQPDLALLAVNTFVKDCTDPNPLVRALAVRTMGCIRVSNIHMYLCDPLRKCLQDEDPYVRKTAAICVLKLYHYNPSLAIEQGFVENLKELLKDQNPMVLTNALAALTEICHADPLNRRFLEFGTLEVSKLLTALDDCTEWGQIVILDSLIDYEPESENEAQSICERVTSRLSHANAAVVLSTVRLLLKMKTKLNENNPMNGVILEKLAAPLVTMLSIDYELQYVALRNINLIVQKYPSILKEELKAFFIKYNDPLYIKIEKLEIMIKLASEDNVDIILAELKEYATEVDIDMVRKAVRAIGTCALRVESAADRCVVTLLELVKTKVSYVVQEAIIVTRDILRKYPGRYESLIETLGDNLENLEDPDARAALIWIMGEYSHRIENSHDILKYFVTSFLDETSNVQLQLLTAVVKLFLHRPNENHQLVQDLLTLVTQEIDNPDIRDRGFFYWRLLSTDPAAAKDIVLSPKPVISTHSDNLNPEVLEELLLQLSSLSSIYHKLPRILATTVDRLKEPLKKQLAVNGDTNEPLISFDSQSKFQPEQFNVFEISNSLGLEFLDFGPSNTAPQNVSISQPARSVDFLPTIFDSVSTSTQPAPTLIPNDPFKNNFELPPTDLYVFTQETVFSATINDPISISTQFLFNPSFSLSLTLENKSNIPFSLCFAALQLEPNYFGIALAESPDFPFSLEPKKPWNIVAQLKKIYFTEEQMLARLRELNIYSFVLQSSDCIAGHCSLENGTSLLLKISNSDSNSVKCEISSSSRELLDAFAELLLKFLTGFFG